MLQHLSIQNFTIIKQLDLEFSKGMTVLTGETGAGKSILIDALLLALGNRADSKVIQNESERCTVTASFCINDFAAAQQWLAEHELISDEECQLRRILTSDGRSRGFINGQPVPLQSLRELGDILVSIHGQHEHQALLKSEQQRNLLDLYAGHHNLVEKVQEIYSNWRKTYEQLTTLVKETDQRNARLELLKYQVKELTDLALQNNELAKLDQEHRQLTNAEQLLGSTQNALAMLTEMEDGSALQLIHKAHTLLLGKKDIDPKLANATELLNNAIIQIDEAVTELNHYADHMEQDPERLQTVEQRLAVIHEMARKYRTAPENLFDLQQQLQQELSLLLNNSNELEHLQNQVAEFVTQYHQAAKELSLSRQKAAKKLSTAVEKSIRQLGMPGGVFAIHLETLGEDQFNSHGIERIEFQVSANPGQPLQPLAKVASGGELSRISLAIHVLTAQNTATPTLIFDEVDVGIGGGTAEIVGRLLRTLGDTAQVLCVTHLPQVAALGHHHFQVGKTLHKDKTETAIQQLNKDAKIKEIARMLGGVKITEQTLAHAREMVEVVD